MGIRAKSANTESLSSFFSSITNQIVSQKQCFYVTSLSHNVQYAAINVEAFHLSHDRFLCVDDDERVIRFINKMN